MSRAVVKIQTPEKSGTGFFILDGQHVATAWHVVKDATVIQVIDSAGTSHTPDGWWHSESADVALLHLAEPSLNTPLATASFVRAMPGDPVFVLGYPGPALGLTLTAGILSGKRRIGGVGLLQVDAAISAGSSGSPVCDARGDVLGVVSFTFKDSQASNVGIQVGAVMELLERPMEARADEVGALGGSDAEGQRRGEQSPSMGEGACDTSAFAQLITELIEMTYRWSADAARRRAGLTMSNAAAQVATIENEYEGLRGALNGVAIAGNPCATTIQSELEAVDEAARDVAQAEIDFTGIVFEANATARDAMRERVVSAWHRLRVVARACMQSAGRGRDSLWAGATLRVPLATRTWTWGTTIRGVLPDLLLQNDAYVGWANTDSPLKEGDHVVGVYEARNRSWREVRDWWDLSQVLAETRAESVSLRVDRRGRRIEVDCEVGR